MYVFIVGAGLDDDSLDSDSDMLLDDSADSDELEVQAVLNNMTNTVKYMYSFTVKYLFILIRRTNASKLTERFDAGTNVRPLPVIYQYCYASRYVWL